MARRKQEEWNIDEWDDSLDTRTATGSDPFGVPEKGKTSEEEWDDLPSEWRKPQKTRPSSGEPKRTKRIAVISAAVAAVILAVVLLVFPAITPSPAPVTDPPTQSPVITDPPTQSPVITDSPAPSPAVTDSPTQAPVITDSPTPTPAVTETPTPSPKPTPESAVRQNEWYGPELRYYYQFLTEHEKEIFDAVYTAAVHHRSSVSTSYFTGTEFDHVFYVLNSDCPELFCLTFEVSFTNTAVELNYRMDQEQYARICSAIHSVFNAMAASFPAGGDEFEKQLVIYRYLIGHCDYLAAGDDSTAYADACLVNGKSQCSGYAYALSLAMRYFGMQSVFVSNVSHGWNLVRINGSWYNCDATWDDTGTDGIRIAYDPTQDEFNAWMNLPDRLYELNADHRPEVEPGFPLPAAVSLQDSYAMRKAFYIPSGVSDVAGSIDQCLDRAQQAGKHYVLIMLDDPSYISGWDSVWSRLYSVYENYQWSFYPPDPSHRCMYAVPSGN